MKKNVIFLVIDSLLYTRLGHERQVSPTPYIDELIEKSFNIKNMYSQAPFTEAAVMALLTGSDTMDNGGYLKRFKHAKKTVAEVFSENGYDTFHQYQPHIYPSSLKRGFNSLYYSVVFDFNALWEYRLSYYSELKNSEKLTKNDEEDIIDFVEENFKSWIEFLEDLVQEGQSFSLIGNNIKDYNSRESLKIVKEEFEEFLKNKNYYTNNLLSEGKDHILFKIQVPIQEKIKDKDFKKRFIDTYSEFFAKSLEANKKYNIKNNKVNLKHAINILSDSRSNRNEGKGKNLTRYIYNHYKAITDPDFMDRISMDYDKFKPSPSFNTHIEHFENWVSNRENSSKPFFAYIHVDDIHTPEMFFSYDSMDMNVLKEEFALLSNYLNKIPSNYKGALTYDYSLVYVDLCVKRLMEWLKKSGLESTTNLVITADHGFSFAYDPIRKNAVNNFYDENYRIPFIIIGSDIEKREIEDFATSMDIAPTLVDLADLNIPKEFKGISLINSPKGRDYVKMEYMGSGCPDITRKPVLYCIRNKKYKVVYSVSINEEFSKGTMLEFYDLEKDPLNCKNIYRKFHKYSEAKELLSSLELRHLELQKENGIFIQQNTGEFSHEANSI